MTTKISWQKGLYQKQGGKSSHVSTNHQTPLR